MILGFKQQFPDKTPTNFKEKILSGEKIHSIRAGNRWRAGMSIQMAYGVRTKNYEQWNKGIEGLERCKEEQKIFMFYSNDYLKVTIGRFQHLNNNQIVQLIHNDGLVYKQFMEWFFSNGSNYFTGQIIHWTNFKY